MSWQALAPSNIALIKYIGKKDQSNLPISASLSYTLDHLVTCVRIRKSLVGRDHWGPLKRKEFLALDLSLLASQRFLNFFQFLKDQWKISDSYLIESANNFPVSAGVASSASSFCALTLATYQMALSLSNPSRREGIEALTDHDLSALSRRGSGSSCRSFFRPWSFWEKESARKIDLPFPHLMHQLILTSEKHKSVSSSEAHQRVLSSPFFSDRVKRSEKRLSALLTALNEKKWRLCFEITWEEFQDLHRLYETSSPPIYYRNKESQKILKTVETFWEKKKDGPLVTMDAGSHVHLLYRPDQKKMAQDLLSQLSCEFTVIGSS